MNNYELMFERARIDLQSRFAGQATWDFAKKNDPAFLDKLKHYENQIHEAWKEQNIEKYREALKRWYSIQRVQFDRFNKINTKKGS